MTPICNYINISYKTVLETVCELYKQHPAIESTCDDNTRMVAFNFVKTCGIVPLYKAVTETYQLQKIQRYLIPKLQKLLSDNFYKDVRTWNVYEKLAAKVFVVVVLLICFVCLLSRRRIGRYS